MLNLSCGSQLPPPLHAESNRIRLNFTSDDKLVGKGFRATWKAECGGTLSLTHGVITSPHYPKYYPNADFECKYLIYPALPNDASPIVILKLLDFDMSTPSFPWRSVTAEAYGKFECIRDYLEIIDVSRNKTVAKYCQENMQSTTSAPPISIKGGIGIRFVGNQSYFEGNDMKRHRGFKISYALADCGGEIKLENDKLTGTITSPGFPLPYHNNLDCIWNITAPEDRIISAKFTNVEMELNFDRCNFDFVELYDGIQSNFSTTTTTSSSTNTTKGLMGKYCGEDTPTDYLITTTPNMTIRFHSDHSSSKGGFKLVLTATLGPKGGCGGALVATDEIQTLIPPLINGKYANGLRCLWNIKTKDPKKVIEMKFTKMNIESRRRVDDASLTGCYDFVAVSSFSWTNLHKLKTYANF
uniref:CUB domain-containing protein n=1 Tax=Panagrolaimus superbus TaxID=310955 RepID=A0A914Y5A1_9BILA